jgi:hypothetical protein
MYKSGINQDVKIQDKSIELLNELKFLSLENKNTLILLKIKIKNIIIQNKKLIINFLFLYFHSNKKNNNHTI